jgi:[ribosomal protein S5]-alanine N-acetyltransferase
MTILTTERLQLKYLQPADIKPLIDLWCDPAVTRFMGGARDRAKLEVIFEEDVKDSFAEKYDLWPVTEKDSCKVVGHCGLLDKEVAGEKEIELIYVFCTAVWGKGYAAEICQALIRYAFEELNVHRLIALIDPENKASEQVAVKVGMHFEKEVLRPGGSMKKVYMVTRNE